MAINVLENSLKRSFRLLIKPTLYLSLTVIKTYFYGKEISNNKFVPLENETVMIIKNLIKYNIVFFLPKLF